MKKRVFSLILAIVMIVTMMPMSAFAADQTVYTVTGIYLNATGTQYRNSSDSYTPCTTWLNGVTATLTWKNDTSPAEKEIIFGRFYNDAGLTRVFESSELVEGESYYTQSIVRLAVGENEVIDTTQLNENVTLTVPGFTTELKEIDIEKYGGRVSISVTFKLTKNVAAPVTEYDLWVGDTQVTSVNKDDVLSDGGKVKYDPVSKTLTVADDAAIARNHYGAMIYTTDNGKLTINGNLTLNGGSSVLYGVYSPYGEIKITGDADITVAASNAAAIYAVAIAVDGSAAFTAKGNCLYAMHSKTGDITVGGDVEIKTSGEGSFAKGLEAYSSGHVTVDGSVTATTKDKAIYAQDASGVTVKGDVDITVTGENAIAIDAYSGPVLIGGKATITGTNGGTAIRALDKDIQVNKDLTVRGFNYGLNTSRGTVTMPSGATWDIDAASVAIQGNDININDNEITLPVGGVIGGASGRKTVKDGAMDAKHVVIKAKEITYYPVWVNGVQVTSANKDDVLSDGTVSYDPTADKLSVGAFGSDLTIVGNDTVDIAIDGGTSIAVNGKLTVTKAADVTVTAATDGAPTLYDDVSISCTGDVTINNTGTGFAVNANLTVVGAKNVTVKNESSSAAAPTVSGNAIITSSGNVLIQNNGSNYAVNGTVTYTRIAGAGDYLVKTGDTAGSLTTVATKAESEVYGPETCDKKIINIVAPVKITSIDISNADITPVLGEKAGDHMEYTLPTDCHYAATMNGWWDIFGSRIMDADDKFEANGLYCACWNFIADDGYAFADDTIVTINGSADNVDAEHSYLDTTGEYPLYIISAKGVFVPGSTDPSCEHKNTEKINQKAPTCTEKGYTGDTFCKDCEETIATGSEISALGHNWGKWFTAKKATCEEDGTERRDCKRCEAFETKPIEKLGHNWGAPIFNWAKDGKSCTVKFICKRDSKHVEILKADITSKVKIEPLCTVMGVTTYTAKVTFNGKTYTDTKDVVDIPALGHDWDEPSFNWSDDARMCSAVFVCKRDACHKAIVSGSVSSELYDVNNPPKFLTYTAKIFFDGKLYTDTKTVVNPHKHTHVWSGWLTFDDTNHRRVCLENASHVEYGKHIFVNGVCKYCGYSTKVAPEKEPEKNDLPFVDVLKTNPYYDDIAFTYEKGIMTGISATEFAPKMSITRGMIVSILYRLEGEPAFMNDNIFTDVEAGSWYEKAIVWANGKNIVAGYGDGRFGPNDPITNEQLIAILYRYAQYKGYDMSVDENTNFLSFNDFFDVDEYAKAPMMWGLENGLVVVHDLDLNPREIAPREEVAYVFHNFCEKFVK